MKKPAPLYVLRFTFFSRVRFEVDDYQYEFSIENQPANLIAARSGKIKDEGWLAIIVGGLASESAARELGERLKTALLLAAIAKSVPISIGEDRALGSWANDIKDELRRKLDTEIRDSIHGIDVYPDERTTMFPFFSIEAEVTTPCKAFLDCVDAGMASSVQIPAVLRTALLLIADASYSEEPLSKATLSIAAVELLAQSEGWSSGQKDLIKKSAQIAACDASASLDKRQQDEVVKAIERVYKIGVNEGIRRLLYRLDLQSLHGKWKEIYSKRSAIFHGLEKTNRSDDGPFAADALGLSKAVVLRAVEKPYLFSGEAGL